MATMSFDNWATIEEAASTVALQYTTWQGYKEPAMAKWQEIEAYIYATDTNSLPNASEGFDHTTHIPVVSEISEDLIALLYSIILPHQEWLGWKGFTQDASTAQKRTAAESFIANRHALNGFSTEMRKAIEDFVRYGNSFVQTVYVDYRDETEDRSVTESYHGAEVRRISPYDIVFDPSARTFAHTPKIIREVITLGELKQRSTIDSRYNEETVQAVLKRRGSYRNVDYSSVHKNQQYVPDGFNTIESYMQSGTVEILWFYGDVYDEKTMDVKPNRCLAVVDRMQVLLDVECLNPRIRHAGWVTKPDNLWAQSVLAQAVGLNYQINHRENGKSDAMDKFIYPDRLYTGDVDEVYDDETGQTKFIASEGGGVTDISPDSTVLTFDNHIDRLMYQARQACRLPQQLVGWKTAGEKTLGEVQSLNDGAFRGFLHKAKHFESELLEKVIQDELQIAVEKGTFDFTVLDNSVDYPVDITITKADLTANGKLVPFGASRFEKQLQQASTIQQTIPQAAGLIGKHLDTYALAKAIESLGDFEQFQIVKRNQAIVEEGEVAIKQSQVQSVVQEQMAKPNLAEVESEGAMINTLEEIDQELEDEDF